MLPSMTVPYPTTELCRASSMPSPLDEPPRVKSELFGSTVVPRVSCQFYATVAGNLIEYMSTSTYTMMLWADPTWR